MEDSNDARVQIKYSSSGFFRSLATKLLENLGVLGFGLFSVWLPTRYQWWVEMNSLKYCMKKKIGTKREETHLDIH